MPNPRSISKSCLSLIEVEHTFSVRFNEVDALGIVWHGHFINYFEQGREAFGRFYHLSYLDFQNEGYNTPVVSSNCEHKHPLRYGDSVRIVTTYFPTAAAKLIFRYQLYNQSGTLACTGQTTQVFLDQLGELQLYNPPFFEKWKKSVVG